MGKIEELIKEKCPNGVTFKSLDKICKISKGKQLNKERLSSKGLYPVINGGITPSGYWDEFNYDKNLITISQGGASAGYVAFQETKFWAGAHCYVVDSCTSEIKYKYIYHFLKEKEKLLQSSQVGAGIPSVSLKEIYSLRIPVPPIEIQEEIVKVLDQFSKLKAELEAELEARNSQYNYYRNNIFKFNNRSDVQWLKLKDIKTDIYRGNGIKRDEVTDEGIPCVRYGEIYTTYEVWFDECKSHTTSDVIKNPKTFTTNDLLFAITGESVEDISKTIAYTGKDTCYAGGDIVVMKHNQNAKYLSYALSTNDAIRQKGKGKVKSKVVHSNIPSIEEIVVPIVSLKEQEQIVKKLDSFYNLITNVKYGIPAEIEARRKQYEYYRNKLLNFEEVSCE